jgi:hypothetical protein
VVVTNGGTAGKLDGGDKIVITYNQPVTTATGPLSTNKVWTNTASSGNIIMIGDAITGCNATTPVTVGAISTGTSTKTAAYTTTWAWSGAKTVLTITIGTRTCGSADSAITGSLTFSPTTTATSMLSATGSFHNCDTNTGGGNCLPTVSGSFSSAPNARSTKRPVSFCKRVRAGLRWVARPELIGRSRTAAVARSAGASTSARINPRGAAQRRSHRNGVWTELTDTGVLHGQRRGGSGVYRSRPCSPRCHD